MKKQCQVLFLNSLSTLALCQKEWPGSQCTCSRYYLWQNCPQNWLSLKLDYWSGFLITITSSIDSKKKFCDCFWIADMVLVYYKAHLKGAPQRTHTSKKKAHTTSIKKKHALQLQNNVYAKLSIYSWEMVPWTRWKSCLPNLASSFWLFGSKGRTLK